MAREGRIKTLLLKFIESRKGTNAPRILEKVTQLEDIYFLILVLRIKLS